MALIDLSNLNVNISGPGQGRQFFGDEGSGAYQALSKLGGQAASMGAELYAKQMDIFSDREALTAKEKFDLDLKKQQEWARLNTDDNTDLIKGTNQTYEEYINDIIDNKKNEYSDTLTEPMSKSKFDMAMVPIISKEKADAVFESNKITTKNTLVRGSKEYSNKSNQVLFSDPMSALPNLNEAIDSMAPYLSSIEKTSGISVAQQVKDKGDKQLIESSLEASLNNMSTDPRAVLDFNLILGPGLLFKDLGEYKKYVMETYQDFGGSGDPIQDEIDVEAYLHAQDQNAALASGHPRSNLLSPDEKKDYLKRALQIQFKTKVHSKEELNLMIKNAMAIPLDVGGNYKTTFQGLDRSKEALNQLTQLRQNPMYAPLKKPLEWVESMYVANANKVVFDHMMTPSEFQKKGYDFGGKFHEDNLKGIIEANKNDPEILATIKENYKTIGTAFRADQHKEAEKMARSIKLMISKSPESAMIAYGSSWINSLAAKSFPKGGGINEKAFASLDKAFNNEFSAAISPWNRDASQNLMGTIAEKYYLGNRALLESKDPNNIAKALDPLLNLSPGFGSSLLTNLESKGRISQQDAMSARAAFALRNSNNQGLYNAIIGASTGASLKAVTSTYFGPGNDKGKQEYMDILNDTRNAVEKFYGYSADTQTKEAITKHISNYVALEKSKNSGLDSGEFIKRTTEELLNKEKINFSSGPIFGTIKRKSPSEDPGQVEHFLKDELNNFKSKMIKGEVDVDMSKVPGYSDHLGKYQKNTKMNKNIMKDFFTNDNYDITLETVDDTGNSRDMYVVARDKKTNQKAMLRSTNGRVHIIKAN